jgi:hypothetical protein
MCRTFHAEWFRIREKLEEKAGEGKLQPQHFRGYCEFEGSSGYIPLKVTASS